MDTNKELPHTCAKRGCKWTGLMEQRREVPDVGMSLQYATKVTRSVCPVCGCDSFYPMKPLFIFLKAEYYDAFKAGTKTYEFRKRSPKFNAERCPVGRRVVLGRGYNGPRMRGVIVEFLYDHQPNRLPGWVKCYGKTKGMAAVLGIRLEKE